MKMILAALLFSLAALAAPLAAEVGKTPVTPAAETGAAAARNVTPAEAAVVLQEKKEVVVLDVRTPQEFANGHLAGAQNMDSSARDFKQKLGDLDKSKSYLVHCASGYRSAKTLKLMLDQNFVGTIYHMSGGFDAWARAGQPVEK